MITKGTLAGLASGTPQLEATEGYRRRPSLNCNVEVKASSKLSTAGSVETPRRRRRLVPTTTSPGVTAAHARHHRRLSAAPGLAIGWAVVPATARRRSHRPSRRGGVVTTELSGARTDLVGGKSPADVAGLQRTIN